MHETAKSLRNQFSYFDKNTVVFIDEIDSIAPSRTGMGNRDSEVDLAEQVSVLLEELVKCKEKGVFVIAATNNPEKIDKAVKDRFSKMFYVAPPDIQARMVMFIDGLSKVRNVKIESKVDIKELALKTKNYTAEKIDVIINDANITSLKNGSDVITMKDLTDAIKKVKAPITQGDIDQYKFKISTTDTQNIDMSSDITTFADVAGMKDIKEKLKKDVILPLKNPKLYEQIVGEAPNGHLLYGAPGCGKTWIAKALAGETGRTFIEMDSGNASSPEAIKKAFNDAKYNSPSILFIDEIDAFVPPRGIGYTTVDDNKITSEFLRQLNECAGENVYVIAATNHPELIDDAVKRTGRFDRKTYVPPLDKEARLELFKIKFKDYKRLNQNVDFEQLAELTQNYTAAQINKIIRDTKRSVYEDIVNNIDKNSIVTQEKLLANILLVKPELNDEILEKYSQM